MRKGKSKGGYPGSYLNSPNREVFWLLPVSGGGEVDMLLTALEACCEVHGSALYSGELNLDHCYCRPVYGWQDLLSHRGQHIREVLQQLVKGDILHEREGLVIYRNHLTDQMNDCFLDPPYSLSEWHLASS